MLFDDTILNRFWAKVDKNGPLWNGTPCWVWTAGCVSNGYGQFGTNKHPGKLAHRIAYETIIGPVPKGLELDHLCRNTKCCNPQHLEAVTHAENIARGRLKETAFYGNGNLAKTHCPKNHPYDLFNTYFDKRGYRYCRACGRERTRDHYLQKTTPSMTDKSSTAAKVGTEASVTFSIRE